jgi:hypothetical protein
MILARDFEKFVPLYPSFHFDLEKFFEKMS